MTTVESDLMWPEVFPALGAVPYHTGTPGKGSTTDRTAFGERRVEPYVKGIGKLIDFGKSLIIIASLYAGSGFIASSADLGTPLWGEDETA